MIYFVQAEIIGRIKIGYCDGRRLDRRIGHLQCGCPVRLRLLAACPGTTRTEARLHARFAAYRCLGEWFDPAPELVHLICQIASKYPPTAALARASAHKKLPAPPPRKSRCTTAVAFLEECFAEQGEWLSTDLFQRCREAGISRNAIFEARNQLGIPRARRKLNQDGSFSFYWRWKPPLPAVEGKNDDPSTTHTGQWANGSEHTVGQ